MADQQLVVGQSVELVIPAADEPGGQVPVEALVFGAPEREYLLTLPALAVVPPGLIDGARVTIRFATKTGLCEVASHVLRVTAGAKGLNVAVARTARVETIQRRRFFRVPACLNVSFRVQASDIAEHLGLTDDKALTQDLSAGGMRIETTVAVGHGDRLEVRVQTPKGFRRSLPPQLSTEALVVRIEEGVRRFQRLFIIGVEFHFRAENERDKWVQLAFDLQRGVQL